MLDVDSYVDNNDDGDKDNNDKTMDIIKNYEKENGDNVNDDDYKRRSRLWWWLRRPRKEIMTMVIKG